MAAEARSSTYVNEIVRARMAPTLSLKWQEFRLRHEARKRRLGHRRLARWCAIRATLRDRNVQVPDATSRRWAR